MRVDLYKFGCIVQLFFVQFLGTEFNNVLVDKLLKLTGCHHKLSAAYHP